MAFGRLALDGALVGWRNDFLTGPRPEALVLLIDEGLDFVVALALRLLLHAIEGDVQA